MIEIVCIKPKTSKISYIKIEEDNLEYIENTGNGGGFFIKRKKGRPVFLYYHYVYLEYFTESGSQYSEDNIKNDLLSDRLYIFDENIEEKLILFMENLKYKYEWETMAVGIIFSDYKLHLQDNKVIRLKIEE